MIYTNIKEKILVENFDMYDNETRKVMLSINEADENKILSALTSKLYDNIVNKVDDIDFGTIPQSKGDITKIDGYDRLLECLDVLRGILKEYHQDETPVNEISQAINNIVARQEMFEKAFRYNIELPMVMYCTMVLAILNSTSYIISATIEFIKEPAQEDFSISLNKMALLKTKQNMVYRNIVKFNQSCKSGEFDKSMDYIIQNKVSKLTGLDDLGLVLGTAAIMGILVNIIPIIRELIFFFYNSRVKISDYLEVQANLLQMSAYNVENNQSLKKEDRKKISKKQFKIADLFRKIANKLAIDTKKSEITTQKDIASSNKQYKASELVDSMPDSASSALF